MGQLICQNPTALLVSNLVKLSHLRMRHGFVIYQNDLVYRIKSFMVPRIYIPRYGFKITHSVQNLFTVFHYILSYKRLKVQKISSWCILNRFGQKKILAIMCKSFLCQIRVVSGSKFLFGCSCYDNNIDAKDS